MLNGPSKVEKWVNAGGVAGSSQGLAAGNQIISLEIDVEYFRSRGTEDKVEKRHAIRNLTLAKTLMSGNKAIIKSWVALEERSKITIVHALWYRTPKITLIKINNKLSVVHHQHKVWRPGELTSSEQKLQKVNKYTDTLSSYRILGRYPIHQGNWEYAGQKCTSFPEQSSTDQSQCWQCYYTTGLLDDNDETTEAKGTEAE